MTRIGFVDFDLDNFHTNTYTKALRKELKSRGFVVSACLALKERAGRAWADANGVRYCSSPESLNQHADRFAVLAPSNPEVHLDLCRMVLPFGKPTFVDKTFAPDLRTARKIFALADKHGTAVDTSSALRYTNVQKHVVAVGGRSKVQHLTVIAPGGSFGEYAIHPVEMVVSCMGTSAQSLLRRGTDRQSQLLINYPKGRTATVNLHCRTEAPYAAVVTTSKATDLISVDLSNLFLDAASAMLDLFETGRPTVPRKESLVIRRILDAAGDPRALKGFVRLGRV